MDTITLRIKNKKKFRHFMAIIKDLDYVEVLNQDLTQKEERISEDDFFALAGMWEGREISAETLRAKAWPAK